MNKNMKQQPWKDLIEKNLTMALHQTVQEEVDHLAESIMNTSRVFLFGKGRTGLVAEMFAMRLTQLGCNVHFLDQSTTPALTGDDLLILISGSGETNGILTIADQARKIGAKLIAVTGETDSSLAGKISDQLVIPIQKYEHPEIFSSKVLTGTLFEQALLTVLDQVVIRLVELSGQSFQDMDHRHANLE
jgi:6-phospho-3-hexuloisomerase